MGTLSPSQMYDHTLTVVKGPSLIHRLDFHAPPLSTEDINPGMVMSLNASGQFVAGCAAGAVHNRPMPVFSIQGINDFDANSDIGNISGGVMSGVVATGGFEIETTEFVAGVYVPNDLVAPATGGDVGKVRRSNESPYQNTPIVGVVSTGTSTNTDGKSVLRFWTVYLPATTQTNDSSSESSSSESSSESSNSSSSGA